MTGESVDGAKQLHIRHWRAKAEELRSIADAMKNDRPGAARGRRHCPLRTGAAGRDQDEG
jgi:hypothetical protein